MQPTVTSSDALLRCTACFATLAKHVDVHLGMQWAHVSTLAEPLGWSEDAPPMNVVWVTEDAWTLFTHRPMCTRWTDAFPMLNHPTLLTPPPLPRPTGPVNSVRTRLMTLLCVAPAQSFCYLVECRRPLNDLHPLALRLLLAHYTDRFTEYVDQQGLVNEPASQQDDASPLRPLAPTLGDTLYEYDDHTGRLHRQRDSVRGSRTRTFQEQRRHRREQVRAQAHAEDRGAPAYDEDTYVCQRLRMCY